MTINDSVNRPSHYTFSRIEVIDAIEEWKLGFHLGNAVKYIARAKHKGDELKDLEKAIWYINRRISKIKQADLTALCVKDETPKLDEGAQRLIAYRNACRSATEAYNITYPNSKKEK